MFIKKILEIKSLSRSKKKNHLRLSRNRGINSQKGFTLMEVIVTLVLVGILAALGGMGIVQAVRGYVTVKDNSETSQKAQMAMTRITREIVELNNISAANVSSTILPIRNISQVDSFTGAIVGDRTITFDAANKTVKVNGDTLIDGVSNLTFTYYSDNATWTYGSNINLLSAIAVNMTLARPNITFQTVVAPRNNGNMGGATMPTLGANAVSTAAWGNCFVATAAYGDSHHPMVQILRDFRDNYLVSSDAGRWFVKQYYKYGPAAADAIRSRQLAMWAVRCLLAPVAAFIFCLMYAPLMIPIVFFVSLIVTIALFSAFRKDLKLSAGVLQNRGSILIGLIITMVIMAILAAAMLPMFSSSYMNQVYADQGRKAYFLAESGFSFAAFNFRDASTETAKSAVLTNMNNVNYGLRDSGSFTNKFYPYWFKTNATGGGGTLVTQATGYVPQQFSSLPSAGMIRVGTATAGYNYYNYSSASGSGSTFTLSGTFPAMAANLDVQPVVSSANGSSTVTNGGDITINSTGTDALPVLNGTFTMDPVPSGISGDIVFRYERRIGTTLQNVTLADATKVWKNFTAPSGTKVVLEKFLIVSSTGTIGSASREVVYNVPVGWITGGAWTKQNYLDKMNSPSNWLTAANQSVGAHSISGGVLAVTRVDDPLTITSGGLGGWITSVVKSFLTALGLVPTPGVWAVVGWDWSNTNTNLAQSWMDAGGNLSYDIQVKMRNTIPYFMTGIGFKLRSNSNQSDAYGYGVSILRQRQTRCCDALFGVDTICGSWGEPLFGACFESNGAESLNDGIPDELKPLTSYSPSERIWQNGVLTANQYVRYSDPVIVLWQRNGPANSRGGFKVLAYRIIQPGDGLTYCASGAGSCTGSDLRLNPWVTLMVRDIEGYELPFASGRVDATGKHFKYGDTITNSTGTKTARVVGTPVMSTAWGGNGSTSGVGKLMLTNVTGGGFASSESLYILGGDGSSYGTTSAAQAATKSNYIMVYYSDVTAKGTANNVQADINRIGNVVYTTETKANWPPDDWTDRNSGNDYFTLVKWHYITPGSNQVSSSGSWTLGTGWSPSGSNLNRVRSLGASIGPSLSSGWSLGNHWGYSGGLQKGGSIFYGSSSSTYTLSTNSGTQYDVNITTSRYWLSAGSANYTFGGVSGGGISNGSFGPTTFTAGSSSTALVVSASGDWDGTLTSCTVRPWLTPGTATIPLTNPLTAGTTFTSSITISGLGSGESVYYTMGSYTSPTYTSDGTYSVSLQVPWDESSPVGNIVFTSSSLMDSAFTISNISIVPGVIYGTLDTTADSQGNVASYVPADPSGDFYQAVVKTGSRVSPSGTSATDFIDGGGDLIALITSSYAPNKGATTFYDDFAVQLDMKSGVGFLPPIQQ